MCMLIFKIDLPFVSISFILGIKIITLVLNSNILLHIFIFYTVIYKFIIQFIIIIRWNDKNLNKFINNNKFYIQVFYFTKMLYVVRNY